MTYEIAIQAVLKHEGGYQAIPADNGNWSGGKRNSGRLIGTKYGIAAPTLISWRQERGFKTTTAGDMKALTLADAKAIYRKQFASPIAYDDLPHGLDYALFDFAVNSGVSRASRFLQRIVGAKIDGLIGLNTKRAVQSYVRAHGVAHLIQRLNADRLAFMKRLKTWAKFGRGWARRVAEVERLALQLDARQDDFEWLETVAPVEGKAEGQMKKPAKEAGRDTSAIGGAGAVITEAAKQIEPLTQTSQVLQYVFVGLLLVGIGLTAYALFKRKSSDELEYGLA